MTCSVAHPWRCYPIYRRDSGQDSEKSRCCLARKARGSVRRNCWAQDAQGSAGSRRRGGECGCYWSSSGAFAERGGAAAALDHAQGVAAVAARLAAQLVHLRAHQDHPATADAQFRWIEGGHSREIKGSAFVVDVDFNPVAAEVTLNLNLGVG